MNKLHKITPVALLLCAASIASCSSDGKDEPTPAAPVEPTTGNIFANGIPTTVEGSTLTTNSKGQVIKIESGFKTYTIEYGNSSYEAESFDAKMSSNVDEYGFTDVYFRINEQGFISYALQVETDTQGDEILKVEKDIYEFKYDSNGLMTYVFNGDDDENFTITYTDGNLSKVEEREEDGDYVESTFFYTNDVVKTPYENKGNIMLFDFWGINIDNLEILYYAGLLGKSTKNLPVGRDKVYNGEKDSYRFNWKFNDNGFPTKFWVNDREYESFDLTWK